MARTQGSFSQSTAPKVFQSALRLFARYGYAAVSMRQIAREVGVHVGALYNYTPDKQSLLFKIMLDHMESLLVAWEDCINHEEPIDQIKEFIRFHLDFHLSKSDAVLVAYMELRNLSEDNFKVIESLRRRYENILTDILSRGADVGTFHFSDARITTLAFIGMLKEVGTWYSPNGRLSAAQITNIYQEMILDFLETGKS